MLSFGPVSTVTALEPAAKAFMEPDKMNAVAVSTDKSFFVIHIPFKSFPFSGELKMDENKQISAILFPIIEQIMLIVNIYGL